MEGSVSLTIPGGMWYPAGGYLDGFSYSGNYTSPSHTYSLFYIYAYSGAPGSKSHIRMWYPVAVPTSSSWRASYAHPHTGTNPGEMFTASLVVNLPSAQLVDTFFSANVAPQAGSPQGATRQRKITVRVPAGDITATQEFHLLGSQQGGTAITYDVTWDTNEVGGTLFTEDATFAKQTTISAASPSAANRYSAASATATSFTATFNITTEPAVTQATTFVCYVGPKRNSLRQSTSGERIEFTLLPGENSATATRTLLGSRSGHTNIAEYDVTWWGSERDGVGWEEDESFTGRSWQVNQDNPTAAAHYKVRNTTSGFWGEGTLSYWYHEEIADTSAPEGQRVEEDKMEHIDFEGNHLGSLPHRVKEVFLENGFPINIDNYEAFYCFKDQNPGAQIKTQHFSYYPMRVYAFHLTQ